MNALRVVKVLLEVPAAMLAVRRDTSPVTAPRVAKVVVSSSVVSVGFATTAECLDTALPIAKMPVLTLAATIVVVMDTWLATAPRVILALLAVPATPVASPDTFLATALKPARKVLVALPLALAVSAMLVASLVIAQLTANRAEAPVVPATPVETLVTLPRIAVTKYHLFLALIEGRGL